METRRLSLALIDPPSNPHRITIDESSIIELAKDIRDRGLLNPITVRPTGDRFEVIAGDRRYNAVMFLGWPMVECRITETITDDQCEALRLSENLQRENLSPYEEAIQVAALYRLHQHDPHLVAKACNRTAAWCAQRYELFAIQDELQPLVHSGNLSIGAALQLTKIDDATDRAYYTRLALADGCTVAVLARWINDYITQRLTEPGAPANYPPMPAPGQSIVVYLDCNLCDRPADTRTRAPKFICSHCQAMWEDFKNAVKTSENEAQHHTDQATERTS